MCWPVGARVASNSVCCASKTNGGPRCPASHWAISSHVPPRCTVAARAHSRVRGRAAFTAIGRGLCAVDAHGTTGYPSAQAARDVAQLELGLAALRRGGRGDRGAAVRALARVGENLNARVLSEQAFALVLARNRGGHPKASWGAASHPTESPDLWGELASLRGEPGAREVGAWIEQSVARHLEASRAELERRVEAMCAALRVAGRA